MPGRLYSKHVQGTGYTVANIASGASLSDVIDIEDAKHITLQMPATWTTASIYIAGTVDGTNYYPVTDSGGVEVDLVASASKLIGIDLAALSIAALRFIKIGSCTGTSATPANQAGARVIYVALKA